MKTLSLLVSAIVIALTGTAHAQVITSTTQGDLSQSTTTGSTQVQEAGSVNGVNWDDFFVFNLQSVTGSVTSATLSLSGGVSIFSGSGTFNLYVAPSEPTITAGSYTNGFTTSQLTAEPLVGTVTFNSPLSGTTGSSTSPTSLSVALNAAGLSYIDSVEGTSTPLVLGGTFTGGIYNYLGLIPDSVIFNSSTPTIDDTLSLSVPEPSTWTLLFSAIGVLIWRFRARRA